MAEKAPKEVVNEALKALAVKRGWKMPDDVLAENPPKPKVSPVEGVKGEQPWWNKD